MSDEIAEGISQCMRIDARDVALFGGMGIDAETLKSTWGNAHGMMWTARVVFHQLGFEFGQPGARRAWIMLAVDVMGEAIDLVAWRPKDGLLASWRNRATLLGEENLFAARMHPKAGLPIHRSPLGWLRARRQGIVIVMPRYAARRLIDHGPFEAEDQAHARELRKLLTLPPPKIVVEDEYTTTPEARGVAMDLAKRVDDEVAEPV